MARAFEHTKDERYRDAAFKAYQAFENTCDQGGVVSIDKSGRPWIEEYITEPPTHILNGFIWALWGVYDFYLLTRSEKVRGDYGQLLKTLEENLNQYDAGFWSLYDLSVQKMKNIASLFYHQLHIIQLEVLHVLSGKAVFKEFQNRWAGYLHHPGHKVRALCQKAIFKVCYF